MNLPVFQNPLPQSVRQALVEAAKVGQPGSFERARAIEAAIRTARMRHPQYFQPQP